MARHGKIARLPKTIREELNRRLQDGEAAVRLIEWLNVQEPVQIVLKEYFAGQPINEPNLTAWRAGGYVDWEQRQETERLRQMRGRAKKLGQAVDGTEISDCFATLMAVEMTALARTLMDKETEPEKRWKRLCQVHKQISRLRRDDHRQVRMMIKRDQWQRETAEQEQKRKPMSPEERNQRIQEIYDSI